MAATGAEAVSTAQAAADGQLRLSVTDESTGKPSAFRLHLLGPDNRPRRAGRLPFWHDHVSALGQVKLELPRGAYEFVVERGPETADVKGKFTIDRFGDGDETIVLRRAVDMAAEGWWSGDLDVRRPARDIELLMQAEDLHAAQVVGWRYGDRKLGAAQPPKQVLQAFPEQQRFAHLYAGEDQRPTGHLLYLRAAKPIAETSPSKTQLELIERVRGPLAGWVDVAQPDSWDLPVWVALGPIDSFALAHAGLHRDGVATRRTGRPADPKQYLGAAGLGRWTHDIYFHLLNCGLRIPPSASSGSGAAPNPVGYNRVYVWVDPDEFTEAKWWEGFRAGRVLVTNGPLVRPTANGRLPGHVFKLADDESLSIDIACNVATRDKLGYFELVHNGQVVQGIRYEELAQDGHFPPLEVRDSGWFLVRVAAEIHSTYRFATCGPWYVEREGEPPRVRRASARFFLDWLSERQRDATLNAEPGSRLPADAADRARAFWEEKWRASTVD